MRRAILLWVMAALLLTSCVTRYRVTPLPGSDQEEIFRDGQSTLIETKKNLVMIRSGANRLENGARYPFVLLVRNLTDKKFTFGPHSVKATTDATGKGMADLHVYDYEELVDEETARQNREKLATALVGVLEAASVAANAGYTANTTSNTTHASDSGYISTNEGLLHGSAYGYKGSYTQSLSYNSTEAIMATNASRDRTSAEMNRIVEDGRVKLNKLAETVLKKHTVMPGEEHGGVVTIDTVKTDKRKAHIDLEVEVDGEVYSFQIQLKKLK